MFECDPLLRWATSEYRTPARGSRQIIDGGGIGSYESISTEARRIPQKIDPLQPGAATERVVPDAGDAVGDRHAGQAGAAIER